MRGGWPGFRDGWTRPGGADRGRRYWSTGFPIASSIRAVTALVLGGGGGWPWGV